MRRHRFDNIVAGSVLDPDVARSVFTSPSVATGGVFAPNGVGEFVAVLAMGACTV